MKTKLILLGVAAVAVLGTVAAMNLGGTDSSSASNPGLQFKEQPGPAEHVGASAGNGETLAAASGSGPKVKYINSKYYSLGAQSTSNFFMTCPNGWKAINGYFYAKAPGVVLGSSFPSKNAKAYASNKPRWLFGVLNFNTSKTVKYYTGIVCTKGLAG